jgi:transcriptional regulator with XRE-family HTH domain
MTVKIREDKKRGQSHTLMTENFAQWLVRARKKRKMSQEALGEKVGLSRIQVYRLERGVQSTKEVTAIRIAQALGEDPRDALAALGQSALSDTNAETDNEKFILPDETYTLYGPGGTKLHVTDKILKRLQLEAELEEGESEAEKV